MVSLRRQSYRLALDQNAESAALVLSAGQTANQSPAETLALAMQVIRELPASVECGVYFLGNPRAYDRRQLEEQGESLLRENDRRVSLMGPVMRSLAQSSPYTRVGVLGGSHIFDLEDWEEFGHWFVFLSDEASQRDSPLWKTASNPGELAAALYDPVQRVEIPCTGFVPVIWDNAGYTLALSDGQLMLSADMSGAALGIGVSGFALQDAPPVATLVRRNGMGTTLPLVRADSVDPSANETVVELSPDECRVFRSAAKQQSFACPHCGDHHAEDFLRCHNDLTPQFRIGGRPIYPSLEDADRHGLFLCVHSGTNVRCTYAGQSHFDDDTGRFLAVIENRSLYAAEVLHDTIDWSAAVRLQEKFMRVDDATFVFHYF